MYTTQWLNEFHWSARGESAEDWLDKPKKHREQLPYPPIKIVFPSKMTVQQSKLGEQVSPPFRVDGHAQNNPREAVRYFVDEDNGLPRISLEIASMIPGAKPVLRSCIRR